MTNPDKVKLRLKTKIWEQWGYRQNEEIILDYIFMKKQKKKGYVNQAKVNSENHKVYNKEGDYIFSDFTNIVGSLKLVDILEVDGNKVDKELLEALYGEIK